MNVNNFTESHAPAFTSKDIDTNKLELEYNFLEKSDSQRITRFSNPLINYDYKTGHYLGS
jgi:hypothetical protein